MSPSSAVDHFKLLIIGAGASGFAAAAKLLESGFTDFRILEAENRIGGRINTAFLGDTRIELGAEWIHGENGNVVYELASKYDLADTKKNITNFINTKFYDSFGHQINKDISAALTTAYYDIMYEKIKDLKSEELKGSLGSYFEVEFQKAVDKLKKNFNVDSSLCKKFLKTFELWENSIDASDSWYETSLKGHLQYWECDGNILTLWKNNHYDTLFSLLAKKIPDPKKQLPLDSKIIFNKEIMKINWNKDCIANLQNVKVECLDGSFYSADSLLVTFSLGVLKERALDMFVPALPVEKLNCIKNLGFGIVNKIFVKFSHRWWGDDFDGYGFLWSEEERKSDSTGWLSGVICFHPVNTDSPILRGWVVGEAARIMESVTNDEVIKGLNFLLNKFLGTLLHVPPVEVCVMSKWHKNPHFRGSYSCRLMKSEVACVWAYQLAQSVCNIHRQPILFFGGEATHDHYYSTVHGAIEAGQREAEKLLKMVLNGCRTPMRFQVAIVGAGISGLAAAKTLLENGVSDIIILEAQSKPGGRIQSIQVEDFFLELGAQWIHGEKNEVFTICQENDLVTNEYSSEGEGLYFRENGEQISEVLIREVDDVIKDILENCETYVLSEEKIFHSIGEELLIKFNKYLDSCIEDTDKIREIKKELFDWHVRFQLIDNSCLDLCNLSAKAWGYFKFCGGNDYINFKNGYSSLIDTLVSSMPQKILRCETSVLKINWNEEVKTERYETNFFSDSEFCTKITTNYGETIYCQYVIVTSSLGYLKKNCKTLFNPSLPKYLSEAIEHLDFGVMDKIFLIYEKPWWDPKVKGFQLVWSKDLSKGSKQHWGRYLTGFDVILKNKPVLLGWVGGEGAKSVEQIPEEELGRQATEILRRFTGNQEIPLPRKVIRTQWWCNEYVRGAYSHITIKCDESEICCSNLAQPVYTTVYTKTETFQKPSILLAGESAHKNHFSTVHGAYESGQSQARVILEHIRGRKSKC